MSLSRHTTNLQLQRDDSQLSDLGRCHYQFNATELRNPRWEFRRVDTGSETFVVKTRFRFELDNLIKYRDLISMTANYDKAQVSFFIIIHSQKEPALGANPVTQTSFGTSGINRVTVHNQVSYDGNGTLKSDVFNSHMVELDRWELFSTINNWEETLEQPLSGEFNINLPGGNSTHTPIINCSFTSAWMDVEFDSESGMLASPIDITLLTPPTQSDFTSQYGLCRPYLGPKDGLMVTVMIRTSTVN